MSTTSLPNAPARRFSRETLGFLFGFLGVLIFSFSLPATRLAVHDLDATFVGLGRAIVAAVFAGALLLITRQQRPTRRQVMRLGIVALGVVVGFPLFSAWALRDAPASHGAIIIGLLPMATAVIGVLWDGDRPAPLFWVAAFIGMATVIAFVLIEGDTGLAASDLALLGAVISASIGYVEGGRLARELGSWQTICWALVLSAPFLILPVVWVIAQHGLQASPSAWLGFGYVSLFSMFLGFFAWYHGLALGGIARVGQVQLIQALLTITWSALLLGEQISPLMIIAAVIVISMIVIIRRVKIAKRVSSKTAAAP
jgi:drug/metabolite transporter (DMT)-like permease